MKIGSRAIRATVMSIRVRPFDKPVAAGTHIGARSKKYAVLINDPPGRE
jgi:hypothetical protein